MKLPEKLVQAIMDNNGIIKTSQASGLGISRTMLCRYANAGILERVTRGQYALPSELPDELFVLQQHSQKNVFSHDTALFLNNMSNRTPFINSVTIPSNTAATPVIRNKCKVYYIKPILYNIGKVTMTDKFGNPINTYNLERTICDILRSRNRLDSETVLTAMKSYVARKDTDYNRLYEYASQFHITKILRQYMDVLL